MGTNWKQPHLIMLHTRHVGKPVIVNDYNNKIKIIYEG